MPLKVMHVGQGDGIVGCAPDGMLDLVVDWGSKSQRPHLAPATTRLAAMVDKNRKVLGVVSHLHDDHINGFSAHGSTPYSLSGIGVPFDEIWVPAIDPLAMYYLLKAFVVVGLFTQDKLRLLPTGKIAALIKVPDGDSQTLRARFPNAAIKSVSRGETRTGDLAPLVQGAIVECRAPVSFGGLPADHPLRQLNRLAGRTAARLGSETEDRALLRALESLFRGAPKYQIREAIEAWGIEAATEPVVDAAPAIVAAMLQREADGQPPPTNLGPALPLLGVTLHLIDRRVTHRRHRWQVDLAASPSLAAVLALRASALSDIHLYNLIVAVELSDGTKGLLLGDAAEPIQPLALLPVHGGQFSTPSINDSFVDDDDFVARGHANGLKYWDSEAFHLVKVPHHGSEHNVLSPLYDVLVNAGSATFANSVATWKSRGGWRHPSAKLLRGLQTAGPEGRDLDFRCTSASQYSEVCPGKRRGSCGLGPNGKADLTYQAGAAPNSSVAGAASGPCPCIP